MWVTFKDLLILAVAFYIAYRYRHQVEPHARRMIITGVPRIETAAARFKFHMQYGYFIVIALVYSVFGILIFMERNQKKGLGYFH